MKKNKFVFPILMLIPIVFYQNCGDVSLTTPVPEVKVQRLKGSFCGSHETGDTFRVVDFYIVNLNGRIDSNGVFGADSDADGVLDSKEIELQNLGFQYLPNNRRTFGILDGLCYIKSSVNCSIAGASTPVSFGLFDTDFPGFTGFDTDQDNILDFVEVLFQTSVLEADDIPSDGDDLDNYEEIHVGRNPNSDADSSIEPQFLLNYQYYPVGQTESCAENQISYEFEVFNLPIADTEAFNSLEEPE
ncbi:MAG: hypothetical protein KDD37_00025, partial [Bdellovibrionales bacterium]|nr:hypothetical protein [Bdellovibrionales bacterium]